MNKVQVNIQCEGLLSLNNHAFELCRDFISLQGVRFYQQVQRYWDYLAAVAQKPETGDTFNLILPFLKASGLTNDRMAAHAQESVMLMPGAEAALQFLHGRGVPLLVVSAGYRPFAAAAGQRLGLTPERIAAASLDLDGLTLSAAEGETLRGFLKEVCEAPEIELPADPAQAGKLPDPVQEAIAVMNRIFGEQLPAMEIGARSQEALPLDGPSQAQAVTDSLAASGLTLADTIYLGNSAADAAAFQAVRAGGGLTISFNGGRDAINAAEVVVASDSAWSIALFAAIFQSWGKEGVLEIAAPETRAKSRALVLPEEVIDPVFSGLDGRTLNIYLSRGTDRAKLAKESLAMAAKLRGEAVAGQG